MMDYCAKNNIEYRRIPMYHSPRASFTSFLFSMLRVLQPVIPIKSEDITESIDSLDLLQRSISSENLTDESGARPCRLDNRNAGDLLSVGVAGSGHSF